MKTLLAISGAVMLAIGAAGCKEPKEGMDHKGMDMKPAATSQKAETASPDKAKSGETWVCPMGEYSGNGPGRCPKCGMDLVKKG